MPSRRALWHAPWAAVAEAQCGIISRSQLLEIGLTPAQAKVDINTGRWQRMLPGVYATFTGPIDTLGRVWSTVLYAGHAAAASHGTALWLCRVFDEPPPILDVVVPESRRVLPQPGLRVHRRRGLDDADVRSIIHPSAQPPRMRVEEAVLDVGDTASASEAVDLVLRATQRRLTTADRLRFSLQRRPRHRWRALLLDVLSDVEDGVTSPLERRYRRDVEHGHGLPAALGIRVNRDPVGAGGTATFATALGVSSSSWMAGQPTRWTVPFGICGATTLRPWPARPRSGTAGVTWPVTHAAWPRR